MRGTRSVRSSSLPKVVHAGKELPAGTSSTADGVPDRFEDRYRSSSPATLPVHSVAVQIDAKDKTSPHPCIAEREHVVALSTAAGHLPAAGKLPTTPGSQTSQQSSTALVTPAANGVDAEDSTGKKDTLPRQLLEFVNRHGLARRATDPPLPSTLRLSASLHSSHPV